jgi:predicted signal transduction protein with EAL and GGDEF domain
LAIIDQYTKDSQEILSQVDSACYAAKDAGRNRIEVHTENSERLKQRKGEIKWSSEINDALENNRFSTHHAIHYRPAKYPINVDKHLLPYAQN